MANQEDLDRAKKGVEIWNEWAEAELAKPYEKRAGVDFSDTKFSEYMDFSGFIFPSDADFEDSLFESWVCFDGARFENWADFKNVKFEGGVEFTNVLIKEFANFNYSCFKDWVDFIGIQFQKEAFFDNTKFLDSTDFTNAVFLKAPQFHNAKLHQSTRFSFGDGFFKQFPDIKSERAEGAYRTLKLAMSGFQAHREEAGFFKLEMMARAEKEPKSRKWLYKVYENISDYGQSVVRPLRIWLALGLVALLVFSLVHPGDWAQAYILAQAQALPLVGAESEGFKAALATVFPCGTPVWYHIFRAFHITLSSGLIFLVLLAIRNRFRIK